MKLKRILAGAMAMTMVLATNVTPVSAAQANKTGNLTVEGDTTYVDTTIYKVTLPTSSSLKFTLDPEGLIGYFADSANASATTVASADLSAYKGKIVGSGSDVIANESSVPIQLTCKYYVTNADDVILTSVKSATDISGGDAAWDDEKNMILLEAVAAKKSDAEASGYAPTAMDAPAVDSSTSVIAINSTSASDPSSISFALAAAPYEFKKGSDGTFTYVPKDGATLDDTQHAVVSLAGFVGADADWSALAAAETGSKLTLNCIYSMKGLEAIGSGAINDQNAVIDATKLTVANEGLKDGDTLTSYHGDTSMVFQVKMPEGATEVSNISWVISGKNNSMPFTADYNEITVDTSSAVVKYMLNNVPAGTRCPMTITFTKADSTTVKYNLTWVIAEPDLGLKDGGSIYSKTGDTSLTFDISLPAGATGIGGITYVIQGKTNTMPASLSGKSVVVNTSDTGVNYMLTKAPAGTYPVKVAFAGSSTVYNLNWVISN